MDSTVFGIDTETSSLQERNAFSPMVVTPLSIMTDVIELSFQVASADSQNAIAVKRPCEVACTVFVGEFAAVAAVNHVR